MDAINFAATGIQAYRSWLDSTANNIANADDAAPSSGRTYRNESAQTTATGATGATRATRATGATGVGQGVAPTAGLSGPNGVLVQEATSPPADTRGYVRNADVNLSQQMANMVLARRSVEVNAATISHAKDAYRAIIAMGNNRRTS